MHPNQYWCHRDVHFFHSAPTTWFSNLALFNRVILRRTRPLEELLTFSVSGTWQIKVAEVQNRENKEVALAFYPDSCWAPTRPDAGWSGSALIKYIRAVWWLHQYPVGFNDLSTLRMIIISFPTIPCHNWLPKRGISCCAAEAQICAIVQIHTL